MHNLGFSISLWPLPGFSLYFYFGYIALSGVPKDQGWVWFRVWFRGNGIVNRRLVKLPVHHA